MTEKHRAISLEKEFELERVSLFSDAVFAIAITLLVIDIKWPDLPEKMAGVAWLNVLLPTLLGFVGFVLSFVFIGRFWSGHLRLFKLLRKYDQGLINRNLLFLFFIVTFPFTAAGLFGHVRSNFLMPLYCYIGNLVLVSAANFNLCRYIFRRKPFLTIEGKEQERKYLYYQSLYATLAMVATGVVVVVAGFVFPHRVDYICYSLISSGLFLQIANKRSDRFEPVKHA